MTECSRCGYPEGNGWICEEHSEKGWPHDACAGPGDPCPVCNPLSRDFWDTPYPPEMQRQLMHAIYERVNSERRRS